MGPTNGLLLNFQALQQMKSQEQRATTVCALNLEFQNTNETHAKAQACAHRDAETGLLMAITAQHAAATAHAAAAPARPCASGTSKRDKARTHLTTNGGCRRGIQ